MKKFFRKIFIRKDLNEIPILLHHSQIYQELCLFSFFTIKCLLKLLNRLVSSAHGNIHNIVI